MKSGFGVIIIEFNLETSKIVTANALKPCGRSTKPYSCGISFRVQVRDLILQ